MSSWGMELKRVPLQALSVGSQQQRQEINPQLPRPRLAAEPQDHSSPAPAITATAPPKGLQAPQHSRTLQAEQASKTSLPERLKGCWGLSPWCRKGSCCFPRPNHSAPLYHACWQGPRKPGKLHLASTFQVVSFLSQIRNPGSPGSSFLYKDSSHSTKKCSHPISFTCLEKKHIGLHAIMLSMSWSKRGQLEVEMRGTLHRKASSQASPLKRVFTSSHHVFSLIPDNPLEPLRCWVTAMPNTHSAAELKGRWAAKVHQ